MSIELLYQYLQKKIARCYENALCELQEAKEYLEVAAVLDMDICKFNANSLIPHIEKYLRDGRLDKSLWERNMFDEFKKKNGIKESSN